MLLNAAKALAFNFVGITKELAGSFDLTLPYPPSCNHAWKKGANGRMYLNPRVEVFRTQVFAAVADLRTKKTISSEPIACDCAVMVELNKSDRRRRDIDNPMKQLLDALTFAKVWNDDSQVQIMLTFFGKNKKHGSCNVLVCPLEV